MSATHPSEGAGQPRGGGRPGLFRDFGNRGQWSLVLIARFREDTAGETVWEVNKDDLPGITLHTVQEVDRLANGNTVICNWAGSLKKADWPTVVQIVEITPEKKVVWALREWTDPDLGPASSIQLLDEPGVAEDGDLQR